MVLPSATVQSLLRRSSSSCRSTSPLTSASSFVKCLAMTSVMWVSVRAAGGMSSTNGGGGARSCPNSPPPLFQSPLVTAEQVRASLSSASSSSSSKIKFLDSSWHLDKTRDAKKEFLEEHIAGAVKFDVDAVSDKSSPLPHMLPTAEAFSQAASEMGLKNEDQIVVYTTAKCFSAARCWWTFRTFGHDNVYILQGGLPAWKAAGGATEKGEAQVRPSRPPKGLVEQGGNAYLLDKQGFQAKLRPELVYSWQQVLRVAQDKTTKDLVADARGGPRFRAEVDEPRAGLSRGRIPGSFNVPFDQVMVEGDWTRFKTPEEIRAVFAKAGADLSALGKGQRVITSCGSGVTAAALSFAMVLAGRDVAEVPVYDGSWAEWGQGLNDVPIEK